MSFADFIPVFIEEACDTLQEWEKSCLSLQREPSPPTLDALFRAAHNLKGAARCVGLTALGDFIHKAENAISAAREGRVPQNQEFIDVLLAVHETLGKWAEALRADPGHCGDTSAIEARIAALLAEPPSPPETKTAQDLGSILIDLGEATPEAVAKAAKLQSRKLGEILVDEKLASPEAVHKALEVQKSHARPDDTIRISVQKLEGLLESIGELSIQQSIVSHARQSGQLDAENAHNAIQLSAKITKEIQSQALSLRMQPLATLFQRIERAATDIARKLGKPIHFSMSGQHVELDKSVIEKVFDPLVHILRNAVDHGLENAEERLAARKSERGVISVEAFNDTNGVRIEVADDGRGLNRDRILAKAREKGLLSPHQHPADSEIWQLICEPGFSTAEQVTDLSGRGVGMDVVKSAVTALGGSLHIRTRPGAGTRFSIHLPVSMNIVEALIVVVDGARYAVPTQELAEIIDYRKCRVDTCTGTGRMINLRGEVIPVLDLRDFLPLSPEPRSATAARRHEPALLTRHEGHRLAFCIDAIEGEHAIVVRPLQGRLAEFTGYSGSTILGNGEPGFILRMSHFARRHFESISERQMGAEDAGRRN